ncbi:MAG: outer membrane beta-barrel protein [Cellvibrionaceae bacterium]
MFKPSFAPVSLALATAIASVNVQAIEPSVIKVGVFDLVPAIGLDQRYDDNIFSQASDEQESWVTVLTPSVQASADLGSVELELAYQHAAGIYENSSDDNYNDNAVSAALSWELNHRNQLDLSTTYNDGHEDRGTGFSQGAGAGAIDEPDTFEEVTVDAQYAYGGETSRGRLVLDISNYSKEFTNHRTTTRGRDRDDLATGATFLWRVGGKTDVLAEVKRTDIDYVSDPASTAGSFDTLDSTATKYLVGVTWEATAKTQGSIKVGQEKKDFDDSDRDDFSGTSWEVGIQYSPKTYSILSLNTAREARETNGTGSFIDAEDYGINWQHSWTDSLTSTLFYSFSEESYEDDITGREDEISGYGLRLDYNMRRWLDLGLSAVYNERDSNLDSFDYERNQVTLHLLMSL